METFRWRSLICGLVAVWFLITTGGLPAHAATLSGMVVMGTAGAPLPTGLKVTVVEIAGSGDMGSPQHVPAAPDGSYSFEGNAGLSHLIGTIYQEVTYSMIAEPAELPAKELKVFETTQDVSVVEVVSDTLTVIPSGGEDADIFEVLQLLRFRNGSDRTYTGEAGDDSVLRLPVPESVFDLVPGSENPAGLAMTPRGLAATVALQPGELSIPYLYKVKVPRSGWQLRRAIFYPTRRADMLIGEGLKINAAPGFKYEGRVDLGGKNYDRFRSESLTPGEEVAADVGFGTASTGEGVWYGLGPIFAILAAGVFAGALAMRRRKLGKSQALPSAPAPTRKDLIDRVARLDEKFDAGGLEPSRYEAERSKLIAELKEEHAALSQKKAAAP